ncbi:uncharacterized protein [Temnothorax longispinosus]|uniref:uncharacterized protein n=1 Tax=Temnothorax longispinosus TaxID=300112 RepID=UPI003A9A658C
MERELWYYFIHTEDGFGKCRLCPKTFREPYILQKLWRYYTSLNGVATCACGTPIHYIHKLRRLDAHLKAEHPGWTRERQHNPSIPSSEPRPSTSREYGIDPSAGHQYQEQPVLCEQVFEQHLKTIQKSVQVRENANKIYSPSVPSSEPGPSTSRGHDVDPSESRSGEQPDSQVLSFEQTTRNPGAVDTSTTSSLKDVDEFVNSQTPEVLKPVTSGEEQLANLYKIDKLVQKALSAIEEHSPSVPSPQPGSSTAEEYDMNPSERENDDKTRSGEQPDSQVLSSEQTRKRKGAVDE